MTKRMLGAAFVAALALLLAGCGAAVLPTTPNVPAPRVEVSPTFCNVGEKNVSFTIPPSRVVDLIVVRASGEGTLLAYVKVLDGVEYVKKYPTLLTSPDPGVVKFEGVEIPRNPANPVPDFEVGVRNTVAGKAAVCVTIEVTTQR